MDEIETAGYVVVDTRIQDSRLKDCKLSEEQSELQCVKKEDSIPYEPLSAKAVKSEVRLS